MVKVNILNTNEIIEVKEGITLSELSVNYKQYFEHDILLGIVDNELNDLNYKIKKDCNVKFIDITNPRGYDAYQKSVLFLMIYSVKKLFGDKVRVSIKHSINRNHYCVLPDMDITDEVLNKIKTKMKETIEMDLPIETISISASDGVELYSRYTDIDMSKAFKYLKKRTINLHKLNDFYDYMYGHMVLSTGYLKLFDIAKQDKGFILQFPERINPKKLADIKKIPMLFNIFEESSQWVNILKVDTVKGLNDVISKGKIRELILISEALHEKKLAQIADMIANKKKTIVLIAGPSSSGKTTFAKRLCIQLRVNGLNPHVISLDDYYVNREKTPLDENGKPDFECVEALDIKQLNEDLSALLRGENVQIPEYNFFKGKREYKGRFIKLEKDDVLVLEGIHGLNERLTSSIRTEDKFKIYISALTQLNIDAHNRIPTLDARLLRRIVRDNQFRGFDALSTLKMWPSVVWGERNYIFPYQQEADVMFNSALVYELGVLKQFAEPLLFNISRDCEEYVEAERLISFLQNFLCINTEDIPSNSIIREFIGGSCF